MTTPTYLNPDKLPYPYCPGCGHGVILDYLDAALQKLDLDPRNVVVVTDIGCSGLADNYLATNTLHGLHGRSVTYATGMKLANPDLHVIVLIGDGGCGIGGHHLINAARRNIGITVLVFNNLNYGMTGGEHSVTTIPGAITATTPYGHLEYPLDICQTMAVNGGSFLARTTVFDPELPDLMVSALQNDGFSLIDIWELCTAYFVPNNRFNRKKLEAAMERCGFSTGIVHLAPRPEYSKVYRRAAASQQGKPFLAERGLELLFSHSLKVPLRLVVAGTAGKKVISAASAFCQGAILSGLWAMQRNDYPVTVKSGYAVAEITLSPEPVSFTGAARPDVFIVLFAQGLNRVRQQLEALDESNFVFIVKELAPVETRARKFILDFRHTKKRPRLWPLMALGVILNEMNIYPLDALRQAIMMNKKYAEENIAALDVAINVRVEGEP